MKKKQNPIIKMTLKEFRDLVKQIETDINENTSYINEKETKIKFKQTEKGILWEIKSNDTLPKYITNIYD